MDMGIVQGDKGIKSLLWYALIVALMTYPIAELSRFIVQANNQWPELGLKMGLIPELVIMWIAYLTGITIMAWRLKRK